ncbi:adenylyl cyclase X E-like isoform X2 [Sitophilus oryzae]|uniref:adenylate cyclase n=1 Tax=Sitophilus oryzae TaxID=7048 RepID=A0A6J2XKN5_SITOR|nr:adenylyl cyclase X E-like isoform X2 [Sitophilus oryzae]
MCKNRWRHVNKKSQFETLELYNLFRKYTDKINFGYFSLFLILTFFLFLAHTLILIAENYTNTDNLTVLIPDLTVYASITCLSVIGLYFLEVTVKNQKEWSYFPTTAFIALFIGNFFVPLYHSFVDVPDGYYYTPAYTFLLIIACYVFFGVPKNWIATMAGLLVSAVHVITVLFISYDTLDTDKKIKRVFSDSIYLVCFNGLGLYFRSLNELVQRKSFLDRRDCIVNTLQLKHEKEQEEQLMSSIIPAPLISKVKENYIQIQDAYLTSGKLLQDDSQKLLETHDNVTILFADIVNYTVMTKKLNINALLETLNELFGRFDDASDKLKVIRIKFLGDCYYCVSGLPPNPPENPAEACVDLGLKMINIIAKVRQEKDLTIDMRIGIHTGRIICGIIGKIKYQFDIWSKDVDIANKMESEGKPGKVHITNKTKELLEKPYDIVPTDKGETVAQFKQNELKTYLVSPMPEHPNTIPRNNHKVYEPEDSHIPAQPRPSLFRKNGMPPLNLAHLTSELPNIAEEPVSTLTLIESNNIDNDNERKAISNGDANGRRNTVYQRRASLRFRINEERRSTSDIKRRTAFMNSNFKRYMETTATVDDEMEKAINNMSFSKKDQYIKEKEISSLLIFRNKKNELAYVKLTDPMFKYYVLGQVGLLLCMYIIENLTLKRNTWWRPEIVISQAILIFVLLPSTWTYFLYLKYKTKFGETLPKNIIVRFLYRTSMYITQKFWARWLIYTVVYCLFVTCVLLEVLLCHLESNEKNDSLIAGHCLVPWSMTQACALTLIMTFLFLKIFIWIKLLYAVITTVAYGCCIVFFVNYIYRNSETFNPYLSPQAAHIMSVVFLTFTLHLIDRQTDYMNRLDFLWTNKLLEEKKKANEQQAVNTHMLINILPKHVAKIYLDVNNSSNELYYESHNNAAVMFASMIFDECYMENENSFLTMMNGYVTDIDTLINRKEFSKVEKIKIAKWTYMAACGLTIPTDKDTVAYEVETHHTSTPLDTLLNFASMMFKIFRAHNNSMTEVHLRIGICHGPIVAGVVGSKKPLYDIWGDAVNMASRMDSTGMLGKIQVLESTAEEIEKLGYECEERGVREVKGAGNQMTYFVKLDSNFDLVRRRYDASEE